MGKVTTRNVNTHTRTHSETKRLRSIQGVSSSTDIHCLLQKLLGLPSPIYFHHPVILGEDGKKLSKRHKSPSLHNLQDTHLTLKNILRKELVINF